MELEWKDQVGLPGLMLPDLFINDYKASGFNGGNQDKAVMLDFVQVLTGE